MNTHKPGQQQQKFECFQQKCFEIVNCGKSINIELTYLCETLIMGMATFLKIPKVLENNKQSTLFQTPMDVTRTTSDDTT